ncbi:translation machinery-associated protein 16 [Tribolium madens]|uniref:translation machinery-associated protein 16 n=1 Tax=Tribolium madens TaxID=41895 RepID=UPI001CF73901|nr:translation machinery-associated protein 16 [Tribolium madens]
MPKATALSQCKHPNSRKTNALVKQIKKTKAREKNKQNSNIKLNLLGEKILWFKDNLEPDCNSYSPRQVLKIIEKYLARFDEELEQIKLKHSIGNRKNRQHASREDIINLTIKTEKEEFNTCGLEIPDLLNIQQFSFLREWNGELRFLPKFKLKRYNRKALENAINNVESKPSQSQTNSTNDVMDTA